MSDIFERKTIAVDFDGTLCENKYPEIGKPNTKVINLMITTRAAGHKIILWTCREGSLLDEAVEWCKKQGLEFDAVNTNLPEEIEKWGTDPRKIGADCYLDDKSLPPIVLLHRIARLSGEMGVSIFE